ncbi:hypothetical protein Peur_063639 [Populus x canadensis]
MVLGSGKLIEFSLVKLAAAGFFVVVTDFLYGDPVDLSKTDFDNHGHEDAKLVIAALRSKGMNSIGAAGSCWGEVKIPVAFLGAEIDRASPPEQWKEYLQNLSHVKILPGVSHGWTVRYNVEDETAAGSAEEAIIVIWMFMDLLQVKWMFLA